MVRTQRTRTGRNGGPPVWGKDAKWWILSQRLDEMRNMARSTQECERREKWETARLGRGGMKLGRWT